MVFKRSTLQHNLVSTNKETYLRIVQLRLSNARLAAGLTQEETADLADLPVRTYQGLEGVRDPRSFNPTLLTLRSVARAVNISLCDLTQDPSSEELQTLESTLKNRIPRRAARPTKPNS